MPMLNHTLNRPALWQALLPKPHAQSHKYTRGYAMIQGGYPVTGAARLAALAAARIGAGMTAIAVPETALTIYASQCLSIMVKPYADETAHTAVLSDHRISAYLIGPGAGVHAETRHTLTQLLDTDRPLVLDADALTVLGLHTAPLRADNTVPCVCTPHAGEFATLTGTPPASALPARMAQALAAAQQLQAVVLLKGAHSIIAAPDGRMTINDNAPATLATAGAGDVLAGLITGLLAQGMPAYEACLAAAWVHGRAATLFGPGLIAEDLPGMVPAVLAEFENTQPLRSAACQTGG